ncbi:aminoglycoside phosphotransferase family protein [Streptomyces sp. MST-110588]|nr:aminoglycoside phosphotransferase family protein [Streptomyces sp. MST-110588]
MREERRPSAEVVARLMAEAAAARSGPPGTRDGLGDQVGSGTGDGDGTGGDDTYGGGGGGRIAVRPIEEGGDHSSWWVGSAYVARCVLDEDGSELLRREIALRDLIRADLGVPVPRSVASGEWAPGYAYTLDTRMTGVSGEERPVSPAGEADLARMLRALAAVPVEAARAVGVPVAATYASGSLVHNDLKGEHLLVTEDGRIGGVLDWTDAVIGDPAQDIAGLAISIGAAAAVRTGLAAGYGAGLCARGVRIARRDTVTRLSERRRGLDDSPLPLLRRQLARAWEATGTVREAGPGDGPGAGSEAGAGAGASRPDGLSARSGHAGECVPADDR